jgi:hypothetical protein
MCLQTAKFVHLVQSTATTSYSTVAWQGMSTTSLPTGYAFVSIPVNHHRSLSIVSLSIGAVYYYSLVTIVNHVVVLDQTHDITSEMRTLDLKFLVTRQ